MKSFTLIYDKDKAMVVLTNPDFAVTELCGTGGQFRSEIGRLRSELDAMAEEANAKFAESRTPDVAR